MLCTVVPQLEAERKLAPTLSETWGWTSGIVLADREVGNDDGNVLGTCLCDTGPDQKDVGGFKKPVAAAFCSRLVALSELGGWVETGVQGVDRGLMGPTISRMPAKAASQVLLGSLASEAKR
jgi:hypothetical protein